MVNKILYTLIFIITVSSFFMSGFMLGKASGENQCYLRTLVIGGNQKVAEYICLGVKPVTYN